MTRCLAGTLMELARSFCNQRMAEPGTERLPSNRANAERIASKVRLPERRGRRIREHSRVGAVIRGSKTAARRRTATLRQQLAKRCDQPQRNLLSALRRRGRRPHVWLFGLHETAMLCLQHSYRAWLFCCLLVSGRRIANRPEPCTERSGRGESEEDPSLPIRVCSTSAASAAQEMGMRWLVPICRALRSNPTISIVWRTANGGKLLELRLKGVHQQYSLLSSQKLRRFVSDGWMEYERRIPWLASCCLAIVWQTLDRWDLHDKRGRRSVHSPDWEYATKVRRIETITWYSRQAPEQIVRLYEDELTYYRRPTVAQGYAPAGSDAPHAEQGQGSTNARRIAACLDVDTGQLIAWQRAHFDRETLLAVLPGGRAELPAGRSRSFSSTITGQSIGIPIWWRACVAASSPWWRCRPMLPGESPVEKVWRKLYQEVLHLPAVQRLDRSNPGQPAGAEAKGGWRILAETRQRPPGCS